MSICLFLLLYLLPGDVARMVAGPTATRETVESIRVTMGLNRPLHLQYIDFLTNAVQGDFGTSYRSRRPVLEEVATAFVRTLQLAVFAQILSSIIGSTFGVLSAVFRGTALDRLVMFFAVSGLSLPLFWSALLLQLLFSVYLRWLPPSGYRAGWDVYILLPALTLALPSSGLLARISRAAILDVLRQDYLRTARAKGVAPWNVVTKHALKNALVPMVTLIGTDLSRMLSGVIIVEVIFSWPGMGKYAFDALLAKDFPALQGVVLTIAATVIIVNMLVDVTYTLIDPRVSYHE